MLNHLSYDLIRVFLSTARSQSIKKTASDLNVTPSAISQSLSKLEKQLGIQLFLREHRKITLAPTGLELKNRLAPLLRQLDEEMIDFRARKTAREPAGTIALGAPPEFGSLYLIQWFSEFQRANPKVRVKLRLGSPRMLLDYLQTGQVDLLIADDGPYYDGIRQSHVIQPLFREELVLCQPASLRRIEPAYANLIQLPHLDYAPDGVAVGIWYQHHFGKRPRNLNIVLSSENARALIQGVKSGMGVAMLPKHMIREELENGSLQVIAPTRKALMNALVLIQHSDRIPPIEERLFIKALRTKPRDVGAHRARGAAT